MALSDIRFHDKPNQPTTLCFPKRTFGKKQPVKRAFQRSWFKSWSWLHYDEATDTSFCYYCGKAEQEGKLKATNKDVAFITKGFNNWKDATDCFRRHEQSKCHLESLEIIVKLPNSVPDIGEVLSTAHAHGKSTNRKIFLKILQNIQFLARQGIALRGHDDKESNFLQLFKLRRCDNHDMSNWLEKKGDKYLSPDIQNEVIQLMSLSILRSIASSVQGAHFFSVMADECVDVSNNEQLVICLRWIDHCLDVHEDFLGLYHIPDTSANAITMAIKDCLVRMNLQWNRCRGQCYDGAASMAGCRTGVASQILSMEPRALYTHCYGHSLNLAMCDTMKKCKLTRDALDTAYEISKLIKFSPKRHHMFEELKQHFSPDNPGFRVLCPTRWTVRAESLKSILENYTALQELWDAALETGLDAEIRSRITGVKAQMESFNYFFGISVGELVLKHGDNLSKALQNESISAAEGQRLASLTVTTLTKIRDAEQYDLFWQLITRKASALDVSKPTLPRKRKAPQRYEIGTGESHFPEGVEEHYRQIYFEILDLAITCVKARFDQPGYCTYQVTEGLLLKAVRGENYTAELDSASSFYGDDFSVPTLQVQLQTLRTQFEKESHITLQDIIQYLKTFNNAELTIYSEVVTLLKLILVSPATNATSERTFSAMRRIKTYLRSTMGQARLNSLMLLHVHKEKTDSLSLLDIANSFVNSEYRKSVFGTFTTNDM